MYKVGDKVRIKSLDCHNENKKFVMYAWCGGKTVKISKVIDSNYRILEDAEHYRWNDEMIKCKVEE